MLFQDLTGQRFGKLTVIEYVGKNKIGQSMWLCRCDCGNLTTVNSSNMKRGVTKSCGCYRSQTSSDRLRKRSVKHNLSTTKLYSVWRDMKQRCNNPKSTAYKYYGGRGIRVCKEWNDSAKTFYDWAMANGYREGLTIDRINVNGDYEPNNCRWATMKQQVQNRRVSLLTYNGETHTYDEWSEITGIKKNVIRKRKNRLKLPIELVLFKGDLRFKKNKKQGEQK